MRTPSVLACLALVGAATLVATPASATPLACGATVAVSTSLDADLTCPASASPALTLGAGVTLNLHGHTITGPGTGIGIGVPQDGDVVIKNGTLKSWGVGVDSLGPVDEPKTGTVTIDRLTVRSSATGVDASGELPFSGGKPTTITRSTFTRNTLAVDAFWFADVWIRTSTFTQNSRAIVNDTSFVDVTDSVFVRNELVAQSTEGETNFADSTLADNQVGIRLFAMSGATVVRSTLRGNGIAVDARAFVTHLELTDNTFARNTSAVELGDVDGSITANTFRANGSAIHGTSPVSTALVLHSNDLRRNGDAIVFDAADANTSLGGNTASRNSGWGIYAPGATDLGGNSASGNGNSPLCVGVVCS